MADTINTSQIYNATITIGGLTCPCYQWNTDIGTPNQLGRGEIHTSIVALEVSGINLGVLNKIVGSGNNIPISIAVNNVTLFGGYYLFGSYEHDMDEAHIAFRDYSCVLFDSKTSIATLGTSNQTVQSLITEICTNKGLNALINLPAEVGSQSVGVLFNTLGVAQGGTNFGSYPKTYWSVLTLLASFCSAIVYTVPTATLSGALPSGLNGATPGTLVFESQPSPPVVNRLFWMPTPPIGGVGPMPTPIRKLRTLHQPQRNTNFVVIVKSYYAPACEISVSSVTVIGQDTLNSAGQVIPSGTYSQNGTGAQIRQAIQSSGTQELLEYEFRFDGLNAAATLQRAQVLANIISSKLFIQTATLDFDSSLMPSQQVVIVPEVGSVGLIGFQAPTMTITGVSHAMNIGQGDGVGEDGLITIIKMLSLPPVGNPLTVEQVGQLLGGN